MQLVHRASRKAMRDHKSGQIAMSRHTHRHIYCPQQIRAMSACFGSTQDDRNIIPCPFSFFCLCILFFFPIDLRLKCVCVVIGATRYLCRSLFVTILLYRRLLWRTGDIVKIPIAPYHRLIPGEHDEMTFSRRSLYFIIVPGINLLLAHTMY